MWLYRPLRHDTIWVIALKRFRKVAERRRRRRRRQRYRPPRLCSRLLVGEKEIQRAVAALHHDRDDLRLGVRRRGRKAYEAAAFHVVDDAADETAFVARVAFGASPLLLGGYGGARRGVRAVAVAFILDVVRWWVAEGWGA
jgi:hypothetical protein